ncbi:hypothetical protein MKW98_023987 [Papaver atlanticum]|uniref:ENTH domain-containing protein n=1 Tax=Papaver atlanticum TaxID=357466 RepID=A0AAD4XNL5_9MAGN|nr:hypothetical protein MKW98_023987 [Papaver atlanticum]
MKILKTASAVLKDKNSILLAKLSRKSSYRNPDLETAIIKATSHDESKIDYKNAQRVFNWVRNSSTFIKPLIWSLSTRMEKTRSWVVALKGLMLMHGIFCCKIPIVKKIGRLPFDLSNFHDCHSKSNRIWSLSAFVRAYFAFLDQKSAFDSMQSEEDHGFKQRPHRREAPMVQVLEELQRSQQLLDMLIQIRPDGINTYTLILEAMDCIIVEIFDVYSKICSGIAGILVGILGASQLEAKMALRILQKAASQGEELSSYFEFCKDIGVLSASEFPKVEQIPEEDIRDLEKIIMNGVSEKRKLGGGFKSHHHHHQSREEKIKDQNAKINSAKAVVTRDWVVFDDDFSRPVIDIDDDNDHKNNGDTPNVMINQNYHQDDPFAASVNYPPLIVCGYEDDHHNNQYTSNELVQFDHYYYSNQGGAAYITNGFNNQTSLVLSQY